MSAESYSLLFDGYWREPNIGGIPAESGVYCVYACKHNSQAGTVSIRQLIYIGESDDVKKRVAKHEKWDAWRGYLTQGEELCFSFAPVGTSDRERVEAALIFDRKPPENDEYKDSFPFDETTVSTSVRNELLAAKFTVTRRD